jgi:hypothetical protein
LRKDMRSFSSSNTDNESVTTIFRVHNVSNSFLEVRLHHLEC